MPDLASKETVEIIKGWVEIAGFLFAILYFGYRLLAGMYVLGRLEMELVSDTPFADKRLVRSTLKLKNVGEATLRVTDARLSAFPLDAQGQAKPWLADGKKRTRPQVPLRMNARGLQDLDFQRVSIPEGTEQLGDQQAGRSIEWLNIEPADTQRREFLQRLEPGLYKLEFRLVAYPMFGRRYSLLTLLLRFTALFSLTRGGQWIATSVVEVPPSRDGKIGIMAYGSLIDDPGDEISAAIETILVADVRTPFRVEFARKSSTRGDAPTLVPVDHGGAQVQARIIVLRPEISEQAAKDMLWRRETRTKDRSLGYAPPAKPATKTVLVETAHCLHGIHTVLYTRIAPNIDSPTPEALADLALASARSPKVPLGLDGISYLIAAKRYGIATPLSRDYEEEIKRRAGASSLEEARERMRMATVEVSAGNTVG